MTYRSVIGIVYDPRVANAAYHMLLSRLNKFEFNTLQLDCRFYNEDHLNHLVKENIELIDGLLLPGNPLDIPSELYGEDQNPKWNYAKDTLLMQYQTKMVLEAKKRGMPILGICQGSKVLNIINGGKVDQDITEHKKSEKVDHDVFPLKGDLAHDVIIKLGTHLHDILTGNIPENRKHDLKMKVNSWHHTAIKDVPENLVVNAVAPDGIIEGIEEKDPGNPNCWGIQFHPEYVDEHKDPLEYQRQSRIFKAFNSACLSYREKRVFNKTLLLNFETIYLRNTQTEVKNTPIFVNEPEFIEEREEYKVALK